MIHVLLICYIYTFVVLFFTFLIFFLQYHLRKMCSCKKYVRVFRGEDLNMKVYDGQTDDDGRCTPSEGKSSHGLWPGELMIFKLHKYYKMTFGKKLQV
jgi:hypothetical protein